MSLTITKTFEWDGAHRLFKHKGKCRNIHGHRYRAEFTITSKKVDDLGMIVDFGDLKTTIGEWIDNNWDHALLLWDQDEIVTLFTGYCFRIFLCSQNPTAEWMARYLLANTAMLLPRHLKVVSVRVYETPTSFAEVTNV